jgi:hypothetical protein
VRLILGIVIASGVFQIHQSPPVFKAEAYVITNRFLMLGRDDRPLVGLTAANFSIIVEKQISVPLAVAEDPNKPGHYLLSFNPPEALRDGKTHRIDVKIKAPQDEKWKTLPLKWRAVFMKPN